MHKIYQSRLRLLAAQILSIEFAPAPAPDGAAGLLLKVDTGESFTVPADWAEKNGVQAGGYLGLTGEYQQGQAIFIPAAQLANSFEYVGDVAQPKAEQVAQTEYSFEEFIQHGVDTGARIVNGLPTAFRFHGHHVVNENPYSFLIDSGTEHQLRFEVDHVLQITLEGELSVRPIAPAAPVTTYTFDEFIQYGLDTGVPAMNNVPWSFKFHGRPVTHENDNCYLINNKSGTTLRFERGATLLVGADDTLAMQLPPHEPSVEDRAASAQGGA